MAAAAVAVEELAEAVMRSRGAIAPVDSGLERKEEWKDEEEKEEKESWQVSQSPSPRRL